MVLLARATFGTLKQFLDDIRLQGGPQSYGKVCVCVCVRVVSVVTSTHLD